MFDLISNKKDLFDLNNFFSDIMPNNLFSNNKIMKLDIKETSDNYEIEVELPGVNKDDINISIIDDILTISVNKSEEVTNDNTKYIRKERKYGSYSRSFSIPNVDTESISANYDNGILNIILPKDKKQDTQTKIINIE